MPVEKTTLDEEKSDKKKNKVKKRLVVFGVILIILLVSCDVRLKRVTYTIESDKVDTPVTIVYMSDLHSDWYGKNQKSLIKAVEKASPDVVLLGGDIFDDKKDYHNAEITLRELSERYPCYYVTGNHEFWGKDIENILSIVRSYGVTVLDGKCETIEINGQKINICGVDDPDADIYLKDYKTIDEQLEYVDKISNKEYFTILMSHRPELYDKYATYDFDLVLSGHAHGGQWSIPFLLDGVYAPHQGIFPEYVGGQYDYDGGTMIVSRGLSRMSPPVPRIFNRPELLIIEVK